VSRSTTIIAVKPSICRIFAAAAAVEPVATLRTEFSLLNLPLAPSSVLSITCDTASMMPMTMSSFAMLNMDWEMWCATSPTQ